jgi:hypothetical protein
MQLTIDLGSALVTFDATGSTGAFPWLTSVGGLRMVARAGRAGASETAVIACTLDNAGQQAARILDVPLRRRASIYDDEGALFFRGTVQRMRVGRTVELTIESGGAGLLLTEDLPLRTTRAIGDFAEDAAQPIRFGDLTGRRFRLLRLSATEYLAAAHPMEIARVFVDAEQTDAWEAALGSDDDGHVWQLVRFAASVGETQEVSATGRGLRDADTGELVDNPADLIEYVLSLAGIEALLPELRAQCAQEGIRLAGSITQARSVLDVVDEIAYSAGAIWTTEAARLYPAPLGVVGPVHELDAQAAGGIEDPYMDLDDTADVLRVGYDYSEAAQRAQHHIELAAAPALYGGAAAEIELTWVYLPANAETIGTRLLRRMAARRYRVECDVDRHDLRPTDQVRLTDNPGWLVPGGDPTVMVLEVDVEADAGATRIAGEALMSTPTVAVVAHSVALPDTSEGGLDVAFRNGIATFTVRDDDGRPLAGARVTLDGSAPRTTDDRGQVSFTATQGPHELLVEVPGYATQRIEFEL